MTKQEKQSGRLAKKLVEALIALGEYNGDPSDILDDAKVRLSGEPNDSKTKEAAEMIYYLECRLSGDDPYGGRA